MLAHRLAFANVVNQYDKRRVMVSPVAAEPNGDQVRQSFEVSDTVRTNDCIASSKRPLVFPVRPHLFVVFECDRVLSGGARYELTNIDEIVVGRGATQSVTRQCDRKHQCLILSLPGRSVSSVHANIFLRGTDWILQDADSTNGSFVNGRRVAQAVLADGDCIELGHTLLTLRIALPTPAETPQDYDSLATAPAGDGLATLSPLLASDYFQLAKVANSNLPLVLVGKTGTGKEVTARAVHQLSGRTGPLVAVNCGALVPNLIESQLFGHVRGAFSGAVRDEPGLLRSADRGTLLLDEIGDLPPSAQVALLRTLQEGEVVPVGSPRAFRVDVRFIAATQQGLDELVALGRFRVDLRSRLEGHILELPTLSQRREDLGILLRAMLPKLARNPPSLRSSVAQALFSYEWPLNVRELEQVLKRAVALSAGETILRQHIPDAMLTPLACMRDSETPHAASTSLGPPLKPLSPADQELRAHLIGLLKQHRGNISEVARATGKARTQVQRWLRRLAIDPGEYRQ